MSFRLVPRSVTLNDLERRNSQLPRNFTEFGSFPNGHDMEVFMYVAYLDQANARRVISPNSVAFRTDTIWKYSCM